ncbi:MAG: hypothetical protein COS40_10215 [Deltaproteobacteria bacterium CG03_land_8_20_14_0_80_45_14]|nr:MAG: hypothetical protein COS40_10215 [Deltaproteobacteria bacterium CG03_land_8_20_14_0_80_45_14]
MRNRRFVLVSFIFALLNLYAPYLFAQPVYITNGLAYLRFSQSSEGYWGDPAEVPFNAFIDTCTVTETMRNLDEIGSTYNSAIQWVNTAEVFNTDYLFTKLLVLGRAGIDVSSIRDYLLGIRNYDGGWGGQEDFSSDNKRTILALQALGAINFSDQGIISFALGYLLSTQNPDGGWGFYAGDDSNVYMTAIVLETLSQYRTIYNLETAINSGIAYLLTKQNPDGGFGTSPSTIYETALAFEALVLSGSLGATSPTVINQAINYLISTQLPNGSWNDDPYSTAI